MKARIDWTSDYERVEYKEFTTLEELMNFAREVGSNLIITPDPYIYKGEEPHDFNIEVYDDYRE